MTVCATTFEQVVVVDFEYEIEDGGLPDVLCMVAYVLNANLQHVQAIKLWRGDFDLIPPFDTGSRYLIRCVFGLGRDDLLSTTGVDVSCSHPRPTHRLPFSYQRIVGL